MVTFTNRSGHSGASFTIAGPGTLPKLQAVPKADRESSKDGTEWKLYHAHPISTVSFGDVNFEGRDRIHEG
ncbi:hypothetical protein RRG08_042082 [Elysia crispata]|uniref:Uncharacterized protein n=1 Tax=Elysia crispata TaxID=231223 RepID=A0AAE0YQE4_9GAST|nr:hypothetical protein RRG08_042082 [Elysia crispata]